MKLEFLAAGSPDCPLIRLYAFNSVGVGRLLEALNGLSSGTLERVLLHEMPGVKSINGCKLTLRVRSWDQAILQTGPWDFECGFTTGTWEDVAGLVEPFTKGAWGFHWLAGVPGEVNWLLPSDRDGQW